MKIAIFNNPDNTSKGERKLMGKIYKIENYSNWSLDFFPEFQSFLTSFLPENTFYFPPQYHQNFTDNSCQLYKYIFHNSWNVIKLLSIENASALRLEFSDKYSASSQLDKKQSSIKIEGHNATVSRSTWKLANFTPLDLIPKLVVSPEWIWLAR